MVITKNDNWFFKRDEANRAALKTDIKNVSTRRDKLQRIVARVVQTTAKELADLVKYEKQIQNNSTPDSTRGGGGGGPAFGDAWGGEVNLDTLVGSAFAVGTVIG